MKLFTNTLNKLGVLKPNRNYYKADLAYHLGRALMIIIFFFL